MPGFINIKRYPTCPVYWGLHVLLVDRTTLEKHPPLQRGLVDGELDRIGSGARAKVVHAGLHMVRVEGLDKGWRVEKEGVEGWDKGLN